MISVFAMIYRIAWLADLQSLLSLWRIWVAETEDLRAIAVPYFSASSWCPPSWFIKSTNCDIYH